MLATSGYGVVMIYIFITFTILIALLKSFEIRNFKKSIPVLSVSVMSIIGMFLYKYSITLLDLFIVYEAISLFTYALVSEKFNSNIMMKFMSYIPLFFVEILPDEYSGYLLLLYCIINIVNVSMMNSKNDNKLKIPMISFSIYSLLALGLHHKFQIESLMTVFIYLVLIVNVVINKFKFSKVSYSLIYALLGVSLVTLNHLDFFRYIIILLFLIYLLISFYKNVVSKVTFNNIVILMICLSVIPTMKEYLAFVFVGLIVLTYKNFNEYNSYEALDE